MFGYTTFRPVIPSFTLTSQVQHDNELYFVTGGSYPLWVKALPQPPAAILEARGLNVTIMKLDPYINVDPGTMSPIQHGEVFVTEDGAETDLDRATMSVLSAPR